MSESAWIDLSAASERQVIDTDVCIIGAGAAGLYLASVLGQRGIQCVVIEAGPKSAVEANAIGFTPIFSSDIYPGATLGRFFGMGGTTTRWGGALAPHTSLDRRDDAPLATDWSHIVGLVDKYAPTVLKRLGYTGCADFDGYARQSLGDAGEALEEAGIVLQASLLLPFTRKNLLGLLGKTTTLKSIPRVYFNAVVNSWGPQEGQRQEAHIGRLGAVSRDGKELRVTARQYVIAAGTLESARLLLELNNTGPSPVLRPGAAPGCYLADHLSVSIADVASDCLERTISLFAPRFSGSWMRNIRLLESQPHPNVPRAFSHFIFSTESAGFKLAKALLRALQARRMPVVAAGDAIAGMSDLVRLAYCQYVNSRLYIPKGYPIHLQLDMEQHPVRENRVSLTDTRDEYGRRMSNIHWRVTDQDMASITSMAADFLSRWPGRKGGLPDLHPRVIGHDGAKPYDAYHPVGTCRLGDDAEAVVDHDMKVWGVDNLWVVSTGVLPSAGTANPTFTMLCLAEYVANHLGSD